MLVFPRYTFDVTKCMFSPGNITEKLRVASLPCSGEVLVDLYAGNGGGGGVWQGRLAEAGRQRVVMQVPMASRWMWNVISSPDWKNSQA